ncbi:MAG: ROK family protein [Mycoplasmatales bacterium]
MKNYLAIDIGGSALKYGIINDKGKILYSIKQEHKLQNITDLKTEIIKKYQQYQEEYNFEALSISAPGAVNSQSKIIYGASALPFIHENNWVNELEQELKLKVYIENDANCAALCEQWLGNGKNCQNIINIVLGTGVGGALIINGELVKGKNLYGGELGFQIIDYNKPQQVLSEVLSTSALVKRVNKFVPVKNGLEVFAYYDQGNDQVIKEVEKHYQDLAIFCYNLMHIFDPDIILIGGAISQREELIDKIQQKYANILQNSISDLELMINKCKFNNKSNLLGAVYHAKRVEIKGE